MVGPNLRVSLHHLGTPCYRVAVDEVVLPIGRAPFLATQATRRLEDALA
jgi:hypothetical protein